LNGLVEEFISGLRAGEPRAVEAANRLLGTMARKHPPTHITERQSEIVGLMAHGFSKGEIAAQLGVSENTVRTHVWRARSALGARTGPHMVSLWLAYEATKHG
jgi:DNA-binding NarL/FixJ family response regulator